MASLPIKHILPVCVLSVLLAGCTDYAPVAASKCPKLVSHSQNILKKLARPTPEMMRECKKLTDEQRGCIQEATIVHDLVQCTKS